MKFIVFWFFCFPVFLLPPAACSSKMVYPPDKKFLKENGWKEVILFSAPKKTPSKFHLDGYGYFDFYISFLARNAEFNQKKQYLELENVFLFVNNLSTVENLRDEATSPILYKKINLPLDAQVNKNCENYKMIVIHKEAINYQNDWVWAYKCNTDNDGSIRYDEIYNNQFFTINNWEWYNVVFRNYNMGVK